VSEQSSGGTGRDPHVPAPIERERPDGSLRVVERSDLRRSRPRQMVVSAEDRPLYAVLSDVLADVHVPDLFPAALATAATDTANALDRVTSIDRGFIDPPLPGASYALSYAKTAAEALREHRDRAPLRLVAVGCSGSKHEDDEPMPAKNRYKGAYWTNKRRYYETVGDDGRIISAEHAVLHPDTPIQHYEQTPDDLRGVPIDSDRRLPPGDGVDTLLDRWALDVYEGLMDWIQGEASPTDPRDVELEVLLGRSYRQPLEQRGVFEGLRAPGDLAVSFPFQEVEQAQGGMFEQIDWMGDEVEAATEAVTDGGGRSVQPDTDHDRGEQQ